MKQREIYLADLNPVKGSEQRGIRPVVIISGNAMNDHLGIAITCPLSTKIKNYAGCIVLKPDQENGLSETSEVLTFQIRTVAKERLIKKLGTITEKELGTIIQGLNEVLTF